MEKTLIKFIVYAIAMSIIYIVIDRLNHRAIPAEANRDNYVVRMPSALKFVYLALFLMGILLFLVFLFFKLKGNPSITAGNFWLSLVVSGIGLFVMILCSRWMITVEQGQMSIHRLFHKTETVKMEDLDQVEVGSKLQLILFMDGKKLITVDSLCDNYLLLEEDLKKLGKIQ